MGVAVSVTCLLSTNCSAFESKLTERFVFGGIVIPAAVVETYAPTRPFFESSAPTCQKASAYAGWTVSIDLPAYFESAGASDMVAMAGTLPHGVLGNHCGLTGFAVGPEA